MMDVALQDLTPETDHVIQGPDGSILTGIPLSGPGVKQNPR